MFLMLGLLNMCLPARGTTLTYVGVQTIPTGTVVGGVEIPPFTRPPVLS
jgi:hypothetical protein